MKTDLLISRLNKQISQIDTTSIRAHIDKGDLDDWIEDWRIETAAVSFGLFLKIREMIEVLGREISEKYRGSD